MFRYQLAAKNIEQTLSDRFWKVISLYKLYRFPEVPGKQNYQMAGYKQLLMVHLTFLTLQNSPAWSALVIKNCRDST